MQDLAERAAGHGGNTKAFLHLALVVGRHGGNHSNRQLAQGHLQEGVIAEIVFPVITTEQRAHGDWLGQGKSLTLIRKHRIAAINGWRDT